MCYTYIIKREEDETMSKWYTVNHGAITLEQTFNTYEEAELMAMAMAVTDQHVWHVEMVIGWDR